MKITSLLRICNEELVIKDTLDHLSSFSDEIFIFDDCSKDKTIEICEKFPKVKMILKNYFWDQNQSMIQTAQRNALLNYAKVHAKNEWLGYFDGDERIEFDFNKLEEYEKQDISMIFCRLFDAYLTKDDQEPYKQGDKLEDLRKWFGPEMREIGFLFRKDKVKYDVETPACRQPVAKGKTVVDGFVKHYGKSIGIEQWEETCRYYMKSVPMLAEKWKQRLGKAIHEKSDFNRELYQWNELINNSNLWKKI